jgi:hypothetical protein
VQSSANADVAESNALPRTIDVPIPALPSNPIVLDRARECPSFFRRIIFALK